MKEEKERRKITSDSKACLKTNDNFQNLQGMFMVVQGADTFLHVLFITTYCPLGLGIILCNAQLYEHILFI